MSLQEDVATCFKEHGQLRHRLYTLNRWFEAIHTKLYSAPKLSHAELAQRVADAKKIALDACDLPDWRTIPPEQYRDWVHAPNLGQAVQVVDGVIRPVPWDGKEEARIAKLMTALANLALHVGTRGVPQDVLDQVTQALAEERKPRPFDGTLQCLECDGTGRVPPPKRSSEDQKCALCGGSGAMACPIHRSPRDPE